MKNLLLTLILFSTSLYAQEELDVVRQIDTSRKKGEYYYIVATLTEDHPIEKRQGKKITEIEMIAGKGIIAIATKIHYSKSLAYFPEKKSSYLSYDYAPNGDLIIWRVPEMYYIFDDKRNEALQFQKLTMVSPDDKRESSRTRYCKYIYHLGSSHNTYIHDQLLLALGRNLTYHLKEKIRDGFYKDEFGTWEVTLNEDKSLINSAEFRSANKRSFKIIKNKGVLRSGDFTIAENGYLSFSGSIRSYTAHALDVVNDLNYKGLYDKVINAIDKKRLPQLIDVHDYRETDPAKVWTTFDINKLKKTKNTAVKKSKVDDSPLGKLRPWFICLAVLLLIAFVIHQRRRKNQD